MPGRAFEPGRDEDVLIDARVVRAHKADAALFLVAPHDAAYTALQHLHHLALGPSAMIDAGQRHQHRVAVEQAAHLARVQVDIIAPVQGLRETVAVAMPLHPAAQQVKRLDQAVSATPIDVQLAVALHGPQAAAQGLVIALAAQVEGLRELLFVKRPGGLAKQRHNGLARSDGMLVLVRLALRVRITARRWRCFAALWWLLHKRPETPTTSVTETPSIREGHTAND